MSKTWHRLVMCTKIWCLYTVVVFIYLLQSLPTDQAPTEKHAGGVWPAVERMADPSSALCLDSSRRTQDEFLFFWHEWLIRGASEWRSQTPHKNTHTQVEGEGAALRFALLMRLAGGLH